MNYLPPDEPGSITRCNCAQLHQRRPALLFSTSAAGINQLRRGFAPSCASEPRVQRETKPMDEPPSRAERNKKLLINIECKWRRRSRTRARLACSRRNMDATRPLMLAHRSSAGRSDRRFGRSSAISLANRCRLTRSRLGSAAAPVGAGAGASAPPGRPATPAAN